MNRKALKLTVLTSTMTVLFAYGVKAQSSESGQRDQEPPSVEEIFEKMDKDEDGQLSEKEVKGRLKKSFDEIDADEDGFLSKEEVENAPKPEGRRPQRQ